MGNMTPVSVERVWRFVAYGNIFIALAAALATFQTYASEGKSASLYPLFIFCSTLAFYNLQRLVLYHPTSERIYSARHEWLVENRRGLWVITIVASFGACVIASTWSTPQLGLLVCVGLFATLYFVPPVALRELPIIKGLHVALCWVFATNTIPLLVDEGVVAGAAAFTPHDATAVAYLLIEGIQRLLFLLPICLAFNIRDIESDQRLRIRTIPSVIGIKRSLRLATMFLIAFVALVLCRALLKLPDEFRLGMHDAFGLVSSAIITLVVITRIGQETSEDYYLFFVDGMIALQAVLCVVLGYFPYSPVWF